MKKKIALLTTGWAFEYLFAIIGGMREAIREEQIDLHLFLCYGYSDETPAFNRGEYNIFNLVHYEDYDGVIFFSNTFNSISVLNKEKQRLQKSGVPAISLEYDLDGIDYVGNDNYSGMREIVEHMVSVHQVKQFAYIGGPEDNYESIERKRAFLDVMNEHHLTPKDNQVFYNGNWSYEFAYDATVAIIESGEPLPEAIICVNDEGAIATITALHRNNIHVPEDILVAGFDDATIASLFTPSLSTVNRNWDVLGKNAIIHLLNLINHVPCERKELLASKVVARGSCGCTAYSDINQKNYCMEKFFQQKVSQMFNRHVRHMEELFIETDDPDDLWEQVRCFFAADHEMEGSDFCIMLEKDLIPEGNEFGPSTMRREGYSEELDVIVNISDGQLVDSGSLTLANGLYPANLQCEENSIYTYIPFHFQDTVLGYFVTRNSSDMFVNRFCYDWSKGFSNGVAKFCEKYTFSLLNQKISALSIRDPLTGLLNRMGFRDLAYTQYNENLVMEYSTAVIFVDINSMKSINDEYGHLYGDMAIKTVAEVLEDNFPTDWLKIRFGGDEYLLIGSDVDESTVHQMEETASSSLVAKTSRMSLPYHLTFSIGHVMISPDEDLSLDEAIRKADELMYQKKTAYYEKNKIAGRANKHNMAEELNNFE